MDGSVILDDYVSVVKDPAWIDSHALYIEVSETLFARPKELSVSIGTLQVMTRIGHRTGEDKKNQRSDVDASLEFKGDVHLLANASKQHEGQTLST